MVARDFVVDLGEKVPEHVNGLSARWTGRLLVL